jgi:hypothetical protein
MYLFFAFPVDDFICCFSHFFRLSCQKYRQKRYSSAIFYGGVNFGFACSPSYNNVASTGLLYKYQFECSFSPI